MKTRIISIVLSFFLLAITPIAGRDLAVAGKLALLFAGGGSGGGGGGTPTPNQAGVLHSNGGTSSTTCVVSFGSAVGVGDTVIVSFGSTANVNFDFGSVTDDKSNTYLLGAQGFDSTDGFSWGTYYLINATNAPTTITVTFTSGFSFSTCMADDFKGTSTSLAADGSTFAIQTPASTGTDTISSGAITTARSGDLIYSATVNASGTSGAVSHGTSFTSSITSGNDFFTEYRIQASAGSVAGTFNLATSTGNFITTVLAIPHQ